MNTENDTRNCKSCKKPPVGLRPRFIVVLDRMHEIIDAVIRYSAAEKTIPIEWIEEYNELASYLENRKTTGR